MSAHAIILACIFGVPCILAIGAMLALAIRNTDSPKPMASYRGRHTKLGGYIRLLVRAR